MALEHGEYWSPNATIELYRVPWDNAYQDVIDWVDTTTRDNWFAAQTDKKTFDNPAAYHRTGVDLRVDAPYPEVYGYNYCHVHNGDIADTSKIPTDFYYFIINASYQNPAVTVFTLMLDVWTTYVPSMNLVGGFMVRSHLPMVDIYANDTEDIPNCLRTYYSQSEGLDVGDSFNTYYTDQYRLDNSKDYSLYTDNYPGSFDGVNYVVLITSTAELRTGDFGSVSNPKLETAHGTQAEGLVSGASVYAIRLENFAAFMVYMANYSWVTQCIIGIQIIPSSFINLAEINGVVTVGKSGLAMASIGNISGEAQPVGQTDIDKIINEGWTNNTEKYKDLRKLWCYPYSSITFDNHVGNVLALKPQFLQGNTSDIDLMAVSMPPFTRAAVFPWGYNSNNDGMVHIQKPSGTGSEYDAHDYYLPNGDALQTALWYTDFPSVSLVNNNYLVYMASNANTIRYNYSNAQWQYDVASRGANLNYDIATNNKILSAASYGQQLGNMNAALQQQKSNQLLNAVSGAGSTLVNTATSSSGGGVAMIGALAGGVINTAANYGIASNAIDVTNTQISNMLDYSLADLENQSTNSQLTRDNALQNAQGNLDNAIQGIQAGLADAQLTPPSLVGEMGGNGFMFSWGLLFTLWVRYMRVPDDAIVRAGQYFRRFGYAVNRYMKLPKSLNVCKYFSYYKMLDMNIPASDADETNRGIIRQIFTRGVTIWSNPYEIGTVDIADNTPDHKKDGYYYG